MKPLSEYTDYRKFLADYYQQKKLTRPGFSYRYFLRQAGIKGPSFLKEVIDAKKNLSGSGIKGFARALELDKKDTEYFHYLVLYNQAKKVSIKQRFFLKLSALRSDSITGIVTKEQFEYFSHWYNVAVREYIHAHEFLDDYASMVRAITPKITRQQAQKAVKLLGRLGLIKTGNNGYYIVSDPIISFDAEVENISAHNVHKSMQAISALALDAFPKEQRYFRTVIGSFSEDAFHKIRMELDGARKRILDIINDDAGERKIYHVGMQLYPLEKNKKKA
jgi:uncharacterized protein (TIGR02147 family)